VEFKILGPIEVHEDGLVLAVGQGNQRALLALLALRAGEVISSDALIDELWGGRPPATAQKSLQVYVSRLRKALGEGAIATRHPGYLLDVEPQQIDLFRFERLVAEARDQPPSEAAATLRDALALWRGDALADVADQPFAQHEVARLEELRIAAVEGRIDADLALGRHGQLVAELESLVQQHPYRERLRGQLMLALYRTGRQADALAVYRDARTTLADELGLEPSLELRELEQRILAQDPALSVPAEAARVAEPRRRRRRYLAVAGLAFAGLVAAAATIGLTRGRDAAPVVAASNSVAVIDANANRVTGAIDIGERPTDIAVDGDDVWVLHPDRSTITHLARASREVTGTVGIGGAPSDLVAERRGVWVSDARTAAVTLIERERLVPVRTIVTRGKPVGSPYSDAGHLASGFGFLWVASGEGVITRIDLRTSRVAGRIFGVETGQSAGGIAQGEGSIWVAGPWGSSPVARIDPRGNRVLARIPLQKFRASGIAVGGKGVWVSDAGRDQVWRIDPALNSPVGSTKVGLAPVGVAFGAGSIWVANSGDGTVSRIDPVSWRVVKTIDVGGSPVRLVVVDDEVWVTVA
jgi:YVTN family beta-propeller protein